ncbi:PPPDE putative peptidase domain containing protein [Nitzschia inconspicua]|uniref:PPPDE putative peptidase domain containing protein n=1 Tax=Nitzschia inconspicua TaxID=303405 RepID=A0A9K3LEV0_9STRA|nr:PPPDE putative peptidase domain containing protein [Nitzschia inconspicua]
MPRRRQSSGSYGVANTNNQHRIVPALSAPRNSNGSTRNRKMFPQSSDVESVERWLTSPTLPSRSSSRSGSTSPRKRSSQPDSIGQLPIDRISIGNSNNRAQNITKGQQLLHDRIATTCADSFAVVSTTKKQQPKPIKQQTQTAREEDRSYVSRIIKQRHGKRFTFDQEDDQETIPAVETYDSLNTIQEEDFETIVNHRPGMTTPGNNHVHYLESTHVPAVPPPPPPPHRPHRPTNATPMARSIPPTHKNSGHTSGTTKTKKPLILSVKPNSVTNAKEVEEHDDEEHYSPSNTSTTDQRTKLRHRQTALVSEDFQQQSQQQSLLQDGSISVSSSVTRPNNPVVSSIDNSLDRHLLPTLRRTNSKVSQGTNDSPKPGAKNSIESGSAGRSNHPSRRQQSRFHTIRDLVSLGSEGISQKEGRRSRPSRILSGSITKETYATEQKKTSKARSPNSCSITAATSGTVMTTPTNDSQDEEISQLTFPEGRGTPLTNGITSHADTEKVRNLSKGGDGFRTIKSHSNTVPKRLSLHIRQPSDEQREKEDTDSRESFVRSAATDKHMRSAVKTEPSALETRDTMSAMTALLRKTNRIKLHVYDLVQNDTQLDLFGCYFPLGQCFNALNSSLHSMGTGAYHVGIEINGVEYAYGANSTKGLTGVFTCMPKHSPGYQYRQTIDFGNRLTTRNQYSGDGSHRKWGNPVPVDGREVVREMASEYLGVDYDLLRKNCCTFAYDACTRLGVRESEIPAWFHNLAAAGAVTQDVVAPINHAFNCDLENLSGFINETSLENETKTTTNDSTRVKLS